MTDVIFDKQFTAPDKLIITPNKLKKILEFSNKKNELPVDEAIKNTIQFDTITVIKFSEEDWKALNKKLCVGQELNMELGGLITFGIELTGEQAGVSYYNCVDLEANVYYKRPILLKKFRKILKSFNEKNELPNEAERIIFPLDEMTVIEFSKDEWKALNDTLKKELSNEPKEFIKLWLERAELIPEQAEPIPEQAELIPEQAGVSYYDCYGFEINGLTLLVKTQKGLDKISQEIKKAERYLKEAYKSFYNPPKNNSLVKEENQNVVLGFEFRELGILTLARIYDDAEQAVSLPNILKCIKSDFDGWSKVPENQLKKKNLDKSQLKLDQEKLSKKSNEVVRKLFKQRDKSIAHLDKAYVFRLSESRKKEKNWGFPEQSELEELITIAKELRDRYSIALNLPLD